MTHARLLAAGLGLALAAAACGGSSTPTPTGGASEAAASTAVESAPASAEPEASEAASSEPEASEAAEPSGPDVSLAAGGDADLEANLPEAANGITFTKSSFDGSSLGLAGLPMDAGELDPILKANGKSIADVSLAIAAPAGGGGTTATTIFALQVRGLPADKILPLFTGSSSTDFQPSTVAGKQVLKGGAAPFAVGVYLKDDVVYYVLFADDPTMEAIIRQLP